MWKAEVQKGRYSMEASEESFELRITDEESSDDSFIDVVSDAWQEQNATVDKENVINNNHRHLDLLDGHNNLCQKKMKRFLTHLLSATVVLEKLSLSTVTKYKSNCTVEESEIKENVTSGQTEVASNVPAGPRGKASKKNCGVRCLSKKYCTTCDKVVPHNKALNVKKPQFCKVCEALLHFQCNKCSATRINYKAMRIHATKQCIENCKKLCNCDDSHKDFHEHIVVPVRDLVCKYCSNCEKPVADDKSVGATKLHKCDVCESAVRWQCVKCDYRCNQYKSVASHIKNQCSNRILKKFYCSKTNTVQNL